jgi:hypothetical protein
MNTNIDFRNGRACWEHKSLKHQPPSSREIPRTKLQNLRASPLKFEAWCFSGAWSLELGAFFVVLIHLLSPENQIYFCK